MLQAKGALSAAQPQGSKPLPPFERWSMAAHRYVQFLTDLRHIHLALEGAIAAAPAAAALKHYGELSTEPDCQHAVHMWKSMHQMVCLGAGFK